MSLIISINQMKEGTVIYIYTYICWFHSLSMLEAGKLDVSLIKCLRCPSKKGKNEEVFPATTC